MGLVVPLTEIVSPVALTERSVQTSRELTMITNSIAQMLKDEFDFSTEQILRLARGQVGTILEQIDHRTLLVEFSDDQGRAYAVGPCLRREMPVLHYVPQAA